jgi:hypothetical protein
MVKTVLYASIKINRALVESQCYSALNLVSIKVFDYLLFKILFFNKSFIVRHLIEKY